MTVRLRILVLVALAALAADQVTKFIAVSQLTRALEGREGWSRITGFFEEKNLDNDPPDRAQSLATRGSIVIDGLWRHRYVENPGAAWGLLGNLPEGVRKPFFLLVSLLALSFILWMFVRMEEENRLLQMALALVTGGALGNLVDRLFRGYVIDFVEWHWGSNPQLRWPTFNVADAFICIGVVLMLLDALRAPKGEPAVGRPAPSPGA